MSGKAATATATLPATAVFAPPRALDDQIRMRRAAAAQKHGVQAAGDRLLRLQHRCHTGLERASRLAGPSRGLE